MSPRSGLIVAIIGATGNVGRKVVELLLDRHILEPDNLRLFASKKSAGKKIKINNIDWRIHDADDMDFGSVNLALFATSADVSSKMIPDALKNGVTVVDSSSYYRMQKDVPLIVMPVNKNLVTLSNAQLFAIANCVATPIATVIAPLYHAAHIKQLIISTYQSVSGAGRDAMEELKAETSALLNNTDYTRTNFKRQIGFNIIPQIDSMMDDGYTFEEKKIMQEVAKIVGAKFNITATSVRVPVLVGHSASISIEFEKKISVSDVTKILQNANSVILSRDYMTPAEIAGTDDVYVGRIRHDPLNPNMIHLWICSDNLRRGAATDMVEVAAELIKQLSTG